MLLDVMANTCKDSFDLFFALYKFNNSSIEQLNRFSEAVQQLQDELLSGGWVRGRGREGGGTCSATGERERVCVCVCVCVCV